MGVRGASSGGERVVDDLRKADAPGVGVRLRRERIQQLWLIRGVAAAPLPFLFCWSLLLQQRDVPARVLGHDPHLPSDPHASATIVQVEEEGKSQPVNHVVSRQHHSPLPEPHSCTNGPSDEVLLLTSPVAPAHTAHHCSHVLGHRGRLQLHGRTCHSHTQRRGKSR